MNPTTNSDSERWYCAPLNTECTAFSPPAALCGLLQLPSSVKTEVFLTFQDILVDFVQRLVQLSFVQTNDIQIGQQDTNGVNVGALIIDPYIVAASPAIVAFIQTCKMRPMTVGEQIGCKN
jgi:hypothetical protein